MNKVDNMADRQDPTALQKQGRPVLVRLFVWMIGLWSLLGWFRFVQTITQREIILNIASPVIFGYLLIAGFLWGILWVPLLWGWLIGAGWTRSALWVIAIFYPLSYWVERIFLWQDPTGRQNWPFMLLLTFFWLGLVIAARRSERVRGYFESRMMKRKNGRYEQ